MWNKYSIIHPSVQKQLAEVLKYSQPTGIQREVLDNYKHYYDFLLASQTGSGKTLAFGIPIVSELLLLKENNQLEQPNPLSCLILTPTRELAIQIEEHINAINAQKKLLLINIVGGLSRQKQLRLLSYRPDIVVATPGRLHELLSEQDTILDLSRLRYLVIDQADRMIEMGHFREVDWILDNVFSTKVVTYDKELHEIEQEQLKEANFFVKDKRIDLSSVLNSLETDKIVELPDDFLKVIEADKKMKKKKKQLTKDKERKDKIQAEIVKKAQIVPNVTELPKIKKKIFLVSATLTKQFKGSKYYTKKQKHQQKQLKKSTKKGSNQQLTSEQSDLTPKLKALISRIKFTSKPKIIDLSSVFLLPDKLTQYVSYCEDDQDRLVHLICYLDNVRKNDLNKKIIIFTNTIKASKLLSQILSLLQIPTLMLHSNMQQRQRLNKLDRFTERKANTLICTDLAARGLDMVIDVVVQFGVPQNGDTYVHRLGRTARAGRAGQGFILVSKKEYSKWKDIVAVLQKGSLSHVTYQFPIEQLEHATQKVQIAEKARVSNRRVEKDESKRWLQKEANDADIVLDDVRQIDKDEGQKSKKLIKKVNVPNQQDKQQLELAKWKKNKMVLSPTDIQSYLTRLGRNS